MGVPHYVGDGLPQSQREDTLLRGGEPGLLSVLGCMVFAWGFALFERELAIALLGVEIPPLSLPSLERQSAWRWLRSHVARGATCATSASRSGSRGPGW